MDRRSRSISPRRYRNGGNNGAGGYRRYSRSRSRSRDRGRELNYRNKRNTRSRSRDRNHRRGNSNDNDLYREIINQDYQDDRNYGGNGGAYSRGGGSGNNNHRSRNNDDYVDDRDRYWSESRSRDKGRDQDRDYDNRDRRDNRRYGGIGSSNNGANNNNHNSRRYNSADHESDDSDETMSGHYYNKTPSNTIIVLGLQSHITEADIMSCLIQMGIARASIRLIRKRTTGASRGFAFVEFDTVDEAAHWMELTQGSLQLQDTCRASLQYSHSLQSNKTKTNPTDWYCGKCGMFNFKRRDSCFKCYASRGESERGGEGSDEISNILTKKIMLRNLDVLTNEEGVLTAITVHAPELAKKISKVLVSRDALTQTSRGICYLHFESLVDSMNMHNLLSTLEPSLKIDNKEVIITYCIDHENRHIVPKKTDATSSQLASSNQTSIGPLTAAEIANATSGSGSGGEYTLADVPRLAEYSASLYASTPAEQNHYLQYYTEYYMSEITKGSYANLPTDSQMTEANSGAAVALSAIQRKQRKMNSIETTATAAALAAAAAAKASLAARPIVTPRGNDGKIYPTPDVSLYQYDETSGYYYDPSTGLYYDAHSQYYYNNETGAYLYWDQRKSSYVLATPAAAAATVQDVMKQETEAETKPGASTTEEDTTKKEKKESGHKHDKVKVAKKIVKDMEKWAKQLNQKKDYTVVATPQPILSNNRIEDGIRPSTSGGLSSGYADVGFSILEKKTAKLGAPSSFMSPMSLGSSSSNKLIPSYGSDSDEDNLPPPPKLSGAPLIAETGEKDYVDFQKLTCLLCKRAFQSLEILQKHLKMSNLHKENLAKHNLEKGLTLQQQQQQQQAEQDSLTAALSYRDRAKERRLKYGESDPPPPNRSRERFEKEINNLTSRQKKQEAPAMPIGSNNVGNRLLQKMGWSEGQGLGRKNQGRTNIIEANARNTNAGLGTKSGIGPGDDYKSYIKKMMKSRYESV